MKLKIADSIIASKNQNINKLLKENALFVMFLVKRYQNYVSEDLYEDLVLAGFSGMIKAINKFDPSRGVKFISYAQFFIRNELNAIIDHEKKAASISSVSLDSPINEDTNDTLSDIIPDPESINIQNKRHIQIALNMIGVAERKVLILEMYHRYSKVEISRHTKLSIPEIDRLRKRGVKQLKNAFDILTVNRKEKKISNITEEIFPVHNPAGLEPLLIEWVNLSLRCFGVAA